jgi:hypothetical protein
MTHCTTEELALKLGLHTLQEENSLMFLLFFKLLNNLINFPEVLEAIGGLVSTFYLRSKLTFYESFHS